MKRLLLLLAALAVVLTAGALIVAALGASRTRDDARQPASEHPETWGWRFANPAPNKRLQAKVPSFGDASPQWIAASRLLTTDGQLKRVRMTQPTRIGLEWQLEHGSPDHGLQDGEYPLSDKWCAPKKSMGHPQIVPETRFITSLLHADVAVTATLGEPVPGFLIGGNPGLLFPLSDVTPLVPDSDLPRYVLVPVRHIVIRGRMFCEVFPDYGASSLFPNAGDRAVIVGQRGPRDTVKMGLAVDRGTDPHFALVQQNGRLRWDESPDLDVPAYPDTLYVLHRSANNAVAFVEELERYEQDGR